MLDSLVTSVDLYDSITVQSRKDKLINCIMHGCGSETIEFCDNNAVKAAQAFTEKYGTCGCDITVFKNIPMGLGLGGSSADSAGVLNALSRLYNVNDVAGLKLLADGVGSDTRYMLGGGWARLRGRGDEVEKLESRLKLNFLLLAPRARISTAECFKAFDLSGVTGGDSSSAVDALRCGDVRSLAGYMSNSLIPAAKSLSGEIAQAFEELESFDPLAVNMTGSGSGVYALFENADYCAYARSRYRGKMATYMLKSFNK